MFRRATLVLGGFLAAACTVSTPAPPLAEESVKPGINEAFLAEEVDIQNWIERFEAESRDIAKHKDAIAAFAGVRPGDEVADLGAGTGLFLPYFDQAVGPEGRVYALDISPAFLEHLEQRSAAEGWQRVELRLSGERDCALPARSVDVMFVCDVYHHLEYPRQVLASLRRALRPGGLLVVVEFERIEGQSSDWVLDHVRAGKETFRGEIEAAGFELVDEPLVPGLAGSKYLLRFRR